MSWKDYFYFQRRDRIAIILLLILIVISGGVYIATKPSLQINNIVQSSDSIPNKNLNKKETKIVEDLNKKAKQSSYSYPYQEKLKNGETIDLNSADTSELKKIPGIGTSYSKRIVKYRNLLGGYAYISQLKEVWGLDEELYNRIIPYLTITPKVKKLKINTSSFNELNKHPYINYKQAEVIIDIRKRKGNIESIERLSLLDEFTENDLQKLTPYLSFD